MEEKTVVEGAEKPVRKPGGWKSMPYVIGNEICEKLASYGMVSNTMVYLLDEFHMKQVFAANVINIWTGTTNFAPLFGAFLSDTYLGRFRTIAYASIASLLGMATLTLTASLRGLRPPSCDRNNPGAHCLGATKGQVGVLYLALGLLAIGAGGIRPCSLPFGVDQFDATTEKGRRGIDSFFNWYYLTFTVSLMVTLTVIVYIQSSVSWSLGLAIPTFLMLCSITLFFVGTKVYIYVKPEGSIFSSIAQVFVAAYKKRRLELPPANEQPQVLYDPSFPKDPTTTKLPLTQQFRCLNKAAIIADGELNPDGSPSNHWKLSSIQQVEELKCLIRIMPIWASGIICITALNQQATFTVSQARKMDRHIGPNFQIPPGSLIAISMLAMSVFIPIYDRILVPTTRRITKLQAGITILQRMGIGMALSVLSMVVGGLIEEQRRNSANSHQDPSGIAPMTVMWLTPQLVLIGIADAFNCIGQMEFYYKQSPEHMKSIGGSLFFCGAGAANYLSSFIVAIVHNYTGKDGQPNWLDDNLNVGKLDYFYYIIAALGVLNLAYFLVCARYYRYKSSTQEEREEHVSVVIQGKTPKSVGG